MECSIEGCTSKVQAKGLCGKHYYRLRVHGSPHKTIKPSNGDALRYLVDVVMRQDTDECVIWPFKGGGYGTVVVNGERVVATRHSCFLRHGPPPTPKHQAAHECGNGHLRCVNPKHLSWKTPQENTMDRLKHGTYQFGEQNGSVKLTFEQVEQIRSLKGKMTQTDIARSFGVSRRNISHIHNGTSWNFTPRHSQKVRG